MYLITRTIIKIVVSGLISLPIATVNAQDEGFVSNHLKVPPSPDAAHLGTYGEVPVSLSMGTANINIPILSLDEGGISIPVTLSYQSHGLIVNERPSLVGMGWTLNAGGVITRTMRGQPDESVKGFLNKCTEIPEAGLVASDLANNAYRDAVYTRLGVIVNNEYDYVPDAFSFNFGGYGGAFYFGNDGLIHTTQVSPLQFQHFRDESGNITRWRVVDENGLIYEFNDYETTQVATGSGSMPEYVSAWHLSSVYNPVSNTLATFQYDANYFEYVDSESTKTFTYEKNNFGTYDYKEASISGMTTYSKNVKFLTQINLNNHHVTFLSTLASNNFKKLQQISWVNGASQRNYQFTIDEFPSSGSTPEYKRSRLTSVTVNDKTYSFQYYPGDVPKRHHHGQDHWGFYNGKSNNSLVPDVQIGNMTLLGDGADRSVSFDNTRIGMLSSITYPTGGSSTFHYQQNGYEAQATIEDVQQQTIEPTISVSGLSEPAPEGVPPGYSEYYNTAGKSIDVDNYNGKTVSRIDYKITVVSVDGCVGGDASCPEYYITQTTGTDETIASQICTSTGVIKGSIMQSDIDLTDTFFFQIVANKPGQTIELDLTVYSYDPSLVDQPIERKVGGLRIAQIDNFDPFLDKTETITFDYGKGGYLVWDLPYYHRMYKLAEAGEAWNSRIEKDRIAIGSSATRGLGPSSIPTAYEKVTEWKGTPTANNGRIINTFFKEVDPSTGHTIQVSKGWKRSKLTQQLYFNNSDDTLKRIDYQYSGQVYRRAKGFRCNKSVIVSGAPKDYLNDFSYHNFFLETERLDLTTKRVRDYVSSGTIISDEQYQFASALHANMTSQTTIDSRGAQIKTTYSYPIDNSPCENNCYDVYVTEMRACQDEVNKHALESDACQSIWDSCYADWMACHLAYQAMIHDECRLLGTYNTFCALRKLKDYQCNDKFKACLNTNGYVPCLETVSNEFEGCQKTAFLNYRICSDNYSACLVTTYENENELNPNAKAIALLNVNNVKNIPDRVTRFNETTELSQTNHQFISYDTIKALPHSSSITYRAQETVPFITVQKHDSRGNPVEVFDHKEGTIKSYIWGYQQTRIIASIIGASQDDISNAVILDQAILDNPSSDEALRNELLKLYQSPVLSNTFITTFTYNVLDGITSQTDSNGLVMKYSYDAFGRLLRVTDHQGNVLKQYDYNYAN